ncbi:MAG: carbon monoxide dehydrogenase [Betaproteobacteria bacterium]|nr:carbon monoxide dehydrogenase [Betaproteobacteria bacterium]
MEMTGEQLIPVSQAEVWRGLNDPQILKTCIAGCESIDRVSDTEYKVVLVAAVGPVKAKFTGKLLLADLNPPNSYALSFEGSGGAAGFGKGSASVTLSPAESGTKLVYTCKANVGGKLAQVGSRLIDGVAKKMANDFFIKFNKTMAPEGAAPQAAAPVAVSNAGADSGTHTQDNPVEAPPFNPMWYVAGVIALMLLAQYAIGPAKYIS